MAADHARALRDTLARGEVFIAPGCYDALTALLVERAGFDCAYLSGASVALSTVQVERARMSGDGHEVCFIESGDLFVAPVTTDGPKRLLATSVAEFAVSPVEPRAVFASDIAVPGFCLKRFSVASPSRFSQRPEAAQAAPN